MNYPTNRLPAGVLKMVCALMLGVAANAAVAAETPMGLDGATTATPEQAKKLVDDGAPIINARVANEYAEARIKSASSVSYKEKSGRVANFGSRDERSDLTKLPADKNGSEVFHCNGPACWWL